MKYRGKIMLRFEKLDEKYCEQYIEMLQEWKESNTSLTPDILEMPCNSKIEYKNVVNIAKDTAIGNHPDRDWYEKGYYFLVLNDQNRLIGATAIRCNLTQLGKDTWGNIAYGIRPTERRKGYGKAVANMLVNKCKELGMNEIIACHYIENDASKKVLESVGAIPTGVLTSEYSGKKIKRYIIRTTNNEINFNRAKQIFKDYIKNFDEDDGSILLKIEHTYHVVDLSEYIAKDQGLDEENINLAKLIALLHDIGRFKQVTMLKDFSDKRFDHADYGIQILFKENMIREFIETNKYDEIIKKAIYNHNKFKIEEGLNEIEELHCKIIRDADKLDNFRVKEKNKFEASFPQYKNVEEELSYSNISDIVYNDFLNRRCIKLNDRKTILDYWICVLAFIFDLYFKSSLQYVYDKNYIDILIDKIEYKDEKTKKRMEEIRRCAKEYIKEILV